MKPRFARPLTDGDIDTLLLDASPTGIWTPS